MTRYHALDSVRAAMMLLGLVLHSAASYTAIPLGAAWPFRDTTTSPLLNALVFGIHAFRMPVFFMMAGFFGALLYSRRGATGLLSNRARRVLVPLVAAWLIVLPFARAGFAFARGDSPTGGVARWVLQGNLIHLWFLYDLLILYAAAALMARGWTRFGRPAGAWAAGYRAIASSAAGPFVWAVPTTLTLLLMPRGVLITATGLVPDARALLAYGVFFGFGWTLYAHADLLGVWARRAWPFVIAAALLVIPYLLLIRGGSRLSGRHLAAAAVGAEIAWLMAFGLTGLAVRYLDRPIRIVRYLSDASYWMYLVHVPLVVWAAALARSAPAPAVVKAAGVLVAILPPLLLSYRYGVRSTVIGEWLNGRRLPQGVSV